MTIPNPHPALFVPGKIIQVRSPKNPLVVCELAFISVEEHVGHVVEMLEWLFPNITERQRAAAKLHDIRKKVGARPEFLKGLKISTNNLRRDFYAKSDHKTELCPADAGQRYLAFAQVGAHRRFWTTTEGQDVRMDLDPPFGNHAAEVSEDDLLLYRDGALDLTNDSLSRNYILSLMRLHHSFQPDRIISAGAQCGSELVSDLYRLIVADHMGSRWAEYVVQYLEGGLEQPDREDFFGDVTVTASAQPREEIGMNNLKVGTVRLKRERLCGEQSDPLEKDLVVRYYPSRVNWDLKHLAEESRQQSRKSSGVRGTRKPRGRRP